MKPTWLLIGAYTGFMSCRTIAAAVSALLLACAAPAAADVQLTIKDGRVWLTATNATVREILAEWARVGQTRIVNGERVAGGPVTLQLEDVPESRALAIVLRSVSGYIAAPRAVSASATSKYDRILVMPQSAPPRTASAGAPPPVFAPPSTPTFAPAATPDDPELTNRMNELRNELMNRAQQAFQELNNANTTQQPTATPQPAAPGAVFSPFTQPQATTPATQTPPPAPSNRPFGQADPATGGSRRPGVVVQPAPPPQSNPR